MKTEINRNAERRALRKDRRLWHDPNIKQPPLGCHQCPERGVCGKLNIKANLFDCLSLCCQMPAACDRVCRNNPDYALRVIEIDGYELDIQIASAPPAPRLPRIAPLIYHGNCFSGTLDIPWVALPLYRMLARGGEPRLRSRAELEAEFSISPATRILLTGTDQDPPLERWWGMGGAARRGVIRKLLDLGAEFATTPNYSLFTNRPRWDDLHSMKRIAIVHSEFLAEGLATALHVNGRTEHDFERWTAYLRDRPKINHIAYEFTTGTGWKSRRMQHVKWLHGLARSLPRPLHLTIRGGTDLAANLISSFPEITLVDSDSFMKTINRQEAYQSNRGLMWNQVSTTKGEALNDLFLHNTSSVSRDYVSQFEAPIFPWK